MFLFSFIATVRTPQIAFRTWIRADGDTAAVGRATGGDSHRWLDEGRAGRALQGDESQLIQLQMCSQHLPNTYTDHEINYVQKLKDKRLFLCRLLTPSPVVITIVFFRQVVVTKVKCNLARLVQRCLTAQSIGQQVY